MRTQPRLTRTCIASALAGLVLTGTAGLSQPSPATAATSGVSATSSVLLTTTRSTVDLQRDLAGLGYYTDAIDGTHGPNTTAAVSAFQRDNCIQVDGIAGPETNATLDAKVMEVQEATGSEQDGAYGPNTTAAVKEYQQAHGLVVDGIAGPNTMESLQITRVGSCHTDDPSADGQAIVDTAASQIGTEAGPDAEKYFYGEYEYLDTSHYDSDGAWCAGFVSWVTNNQLGVQPYNEVNVNAYRARAAANDGMSFTSSAAPGDLVVYDWDNDGSYDHIGIVQAANGTSLTTIEGNTHSEDNTSPSGVWQRYRSTTAGYGVQFIRLQ